MSAGIHFDFKVPLWYVLFTTVLVYKHHLILAVSSKVYLFPMRLRETENTFKAEDLDKSIHTALYVKLNFTYSKMKEKFQLENRSFNSSLASSLCSLLSSSTLCDCTLICSDGQLSAHKVILAAISSFFSSVFSLHHHQHPLIYMRGVKTGQMQAVLSYAYSGGAQVAQDNLPSFLALAEDLEIEGLLKRETDVEISVNLN